jgi:hypothetical protein
MSQIFDMRRQFGKHACQQSMQLIDQRASQTTTTPNSDIERAAASICEPAVTVRTTRLRVVLTTVVVMFQHVGWSLNLDFTH